MAERSAIGLFAGSNLTTVDACVERARGAADDGFASVWFPQTVSIDALAALAAVAREVPDIELGTAVVPIQGRHPIALALQGLTIADAAGPGRFTLGLGVTHKVVSEGWFGIPYRGMVDVCAEVLDVINDLFSPRRRTDYTGRHLSASLSTPIEAEAPGLMLAALGPRMLELAGRVADGTITWMTGPVGLAERIVPVLHASAEAAGKPRPRIVVGLPVCVTDDDDGARERLAPMMSMYATMPSYRRKVEAERIDDAVDLAVVGSEDVVLEKLEVLTRSGMTELCANIVGTDGEKQRTRALLGSLNAS